MLPDKANLSCERHWLASLQVIAAACTPMQPDRRSQRALVHVGPPHCEPGRWSAQLSAKSEVARRTACSCGDMAYAHGSSSGGGRVSEANAGAVVMPAAPEASMSLPSVHGQRVLEGFSKAATPAWMGPRDGGATAEHASPQSRLASRLALFPSTRLLQRSPVAALASAGRDRGLMMRGLDLMAHPRPCGRCRDANVTKPRWPLRNRCGCGRERR
ncbi:hypothetical protein IQ06DRAFT_365454 [Phaeosphaeriaceae sp. SRC1lsM3a]|nr:hypothetical protein IQ06DRAFT_365454 [Stagonospora sp. SRC1lsM3a]